MARYHSRDLFGSQKGEGEGEGACKLISMSRIEVNSTNVLLTN